MNRPEQRQPARSDSGSTPPEGSSLRETIESIIIAFILAFVFRAFVVEAFVIPTGSMAPTLLGKHVSLTCPQCGYRFDVGPRHSGNRDNPNRIQGNAARPLRAFCPMCDYPISQRSRALDAGDRILVLKYLYGFSEPRRWDVVVFKNPENPVDNYIKRLVGLPNERLWIVGGNIYTQALGPDGRPRRPDTWTIQRKTTRPKVQRAVWLPIYHSRYVPLDGGQPSRDPDSRTGRLRVWQRPWQPAGDQAGRWTSLYDGRAFRFTGGSEPARLTFHYPTPVEARDFSPYNFNSLPPDNRYLFVVEDLRLAATVRPTGPAQVSLQLKTHRYQFRLTVDTTGDPPRLLVKGNGWEQWTRPPDLRLPGSGPVLKVGRPNRVELWHVDQQVQLWVDGRLRADWPYDSRLTTEQLLALDRLRLTEQPVLGLEVQGSAMTLSRLDVDRDIYYTPNARGNWQNGARGTTGNIAHIGPDRFFCLGDNSPFSKDSRLWSRIDEWIAYHSRLQGHPTGPGYVPREMMIGRAFFVYFPAPHRFHPTGPWLVPNFGKLRFIH